MFGRVPSMKHRSDSRIRSSNSVRKRTLQFDVLEDRRLFAGMDANLRVLVFQDPLSVRTPNLATSPAAERVVFVDLNRDGNFQSQEPWSITDQQGFATFRGLANGSYSIRLLSQQSVVETTSSAPAPLGEWTRNLGVRQGLDWESETIGWFAGPRSIQRWDVSRKELLAEIDLGASIVSATVLDASNDLVLTHTASGSQLLKVNRQTQDFQTVVNRLGPIDSFAITGDRVVYLASNSLGYGLYSTSIDHEGFGFLQNEPAMPVIGGLSNQGTTVHSIGPRDIVLLEKLDTETRISSWQLRGDEWQLVAERMFNEEVRFSSSLSDSNRFVVEVPGGLAILNNTSGLPVLDMIEQAAGPVVFDPSRNVLLTQSRTKSGTISAWSTSDWNHLYDIPVSNSSITAQESSWGLSLGYLKDHVILVADGRVYRHALTSAVGASVSISDSAIRQIAIGVRTRGDNRVPSLAELPDFVTEEDSPFSIPQNAIDSRGSDEDGDPLYYFVRTSGEKGQMQWSSSAFAVFQPSPNAHGTDEWVVQAFDGRSWSNPQTFNIDIRPVNDPPSGVSLASEYRVPESIPGATLGRFEVIDPDADAQYRYAVSDGRFMVASGVLKLVPGVSLDFEAASSLVVTVSAIELNQNDFISRQVTVHVEDRNDPPQGILFHGSGAIPEKVAPYVIGNVNVVDQDRLEVFNISVTDPRFEVVRNSVRVKPGNGIVYQDPGWVELTFVAVSASTGDRLSRTERFQVIKDETPYHNEENPMDVDGDGVITPLDPLLIINYINNHGPGTVSQGEGESGGQIDVDGDGEVSPIDILIIINSLNERNNQSNGSSNSSGGGNLLSGEGEGASKSSPPSWSQDEDELSVRRSRRLGR
jgi:hypothetical protein